MSPSLVRLGPLDCYQIDGGDGPVVSVVMCHGFGAPGDDLVGLADEWIARLGEDAGRCRFVFPAAPHDLAALGMPGGRAWWPINVARLAELAMADRFDELYDVRPPGMDEASEQLSASVAAVLRETGDGSGPLILGGFSQGAMVSMDVALRLPHPPAALFQFSGTLLCRDRWRAAIDRLARSAVLVTHGRQDPILPYSAAEDLRELLSGGGVDVDFVGFDGPHTIHAGGVDRSVTLLRKVIASV